MDAAPGHKPDRLSTGNLEAAVPSRSRDGRAIYFASRPNGVWNVYRAFVSGAAPEQLTRNGGFRAVESWNGEWVYFTKASVKGLWRVLVGSEREQAWIPDFPVSMWGNWAVGPAGVSYLRPAIGSETRGPAAIELLRSDSNEPERVGQTEKPPTAGGFSAAADHNSFLYTQLDQRGSDILLQER